MQSLLSGFVAHKQELFVWLKQKWAELFNADFEVLLYDEGGGPWRWVRSSAIGSGQHNSCCNTGMGGCFC